MHCNTFFHQFQGGPLELYCNVSSITGDRIPVACHTDKTPTAFTCAIDDGSAKNCELIC